jgi:S1-C subfamily serine protease
VRAGDLITGLDGDTVTSSQDLVSKLAQRRPGSEVELAGRHGLKAYKVKLAVTERPIRLAQSEMPP